MLPQVHATSAILGSIASVMILRHAPGRETQGAVARVLLTFALRDAVGPWDRVSPMFARADGEDSAERPSERTAAVAPSWIRERGELVLGRTGEPEVSKFRGGRAGETRGSVASRLAAALVAALALAGAPAGAQQFNSDNQWTAPHGVGTFVLTAGQEYSAFVATAALLEDWEFNLTLTLFPEDPENQSEDHYSGGFYVKHRLWQNEAETGGFALMFGTGNSPSYLAEGEVTDTFRSWWANAVYTIPFRDGDVQLDLLPGFIATFDKDRQGSDTWNAAYSSRLAVYKIIPSSAIVAEVFGTVGEQHAPPQYRAGIRWESPHVIVAGTYGRQFDGEGGARFELGLIMLTNPLKIFCLGGGCG